LIHREKPWDKNLQLLLALIVAFNVAPHVIHVPAWITALALVCFSWKYLYLSQGVPLPQRWLLAVAAVVASAGCFIHYGTILGHQAASGLLVCLASLKLLETNRYRDAMLVIFTSFFLLMAHLLESQSLLSTVFMSLDVLLITTLMFHIHKRDRRQSVRSLRPAMRMLGLALPVWILLFFVFPRFTSVFWDAPQLEAGTGFGDDLNPGSIDRLIENEAPAFRAAFQAGRLPSPESLYWRGAILSVSEGLRWNRVSRPGSRNSEILPASEDEPSQQTTYDVWLEPGFQKWLFVLEYVNGFQAGDWVKTHRIQQQQGFVFEAGREIRTRLPYSATASREAPLQRLSEPERRLFLQLPAGLDDRTIALAQSLAGPNAKAEQLSRRLLDWFDENGFRYTREPGALKAKTGVNQLSEFLFETRRGFCEHFAGTYATLMRAMGVPARVVVGFQGGQYNELGDYLLVRHLDAHAWAEIWVKSSDSDPLQGRWKRVDPTETVAPLRIQLGGEYNRLDSEALALGLSGADLRRGMNSRLGRIFSQGALAWDAIQMKWNAFLLSYDFEYQMQLLNSLGLKTASGVILVVILISLLAAIGFGLVFALRFRARKPDPVLAEWRRFCRALEKGGVVREETEGPLAFGQRAALAQPRNAAVIREVVDLYINLRFSRLDTHSSRQLAQKFKKAVRQSVRLVSRP
jgi:protein-glutamine gamma-glutamyltransferase